jgi:hypothetical protein
MLNGRSLMNLKGFLRELFLPNEDIIPAFS